MPKHVLNCLCRSCLMPVTSGFSVTVVVWFHLRRHCWHANCLTHCALCSRSQLKLKQAHTAATQQCVNLQAYCCRRQCGDLAAVRLAKLGTAEAHMLQPEAKAYQHCKQLQYQVAPEVSADGPAVNATAYLLVTCLLPVGFSDCSSAKYKTLHAVKALHGLQVATSCVYLRRSTPARLY